MTSENTNEAAPAQALGPVMCVVGARPNFMKMAPILRALAAHQPPLPAMLVHTGQHHDQGISHQFFEDLGLTLRENTERPITAEQGTNSLVGRDADAIRAGVASILRGEGKRGRVPELWDGHAADRIAADLWRWLRAGAP